MHNEPVTPAKTPAQRGVRTLLQVAGGLFVGLCLAVWNVPGVPETIVAFARQNFLPLFIELLALFGLPSAVIAYVQNRLETKR